MLSLEIIFQKPIANKRNFIATKLLIIYFIISILGEIAADENIFCIFPGVENNGNQQQPPVYLTNKLT